MAVPSASPCPAQAALGRCLCCVCALLGGVAGGDSWGHVDGLSCSCCQLWMCHCLCLVSELLPVWVCLHTRASKGHKWLEAGMIYPPLGAPVRQEMQMFQMFCPGPFSAKHTQGLYLAEFLRMMQHQWCCWVLNDSSKNELVLQLGTVKWWELRQCRINDLFYSEENYLQKK